MAALSICLRFAATPGAAAVLAASERALPAPPSDHAHVLRSLDGGHGADVNSLLGRGFLVGLRGGHGSDSNGLRADGVLVVLDSGHGAGSNCLLADGVLVIVALDGGNEAGRVRSRHDFRLQ